VILAIPASLDTILATGQVCIFSEFIMRATRLALLFIVISISSFAQQSASTPTTLSGCMQSLNGSFGLTTSNGIRYVLKGDHDTLLSYNGKQVEVKGTMKATKKTSSKPPTFHVTEVKKIADFCQ
jgi:hypothetical protein